MDISEEIKKLTLNREWKVDSADQYYYTTYFIGNIIINKVINISNGFCSFSTQTFIGSNMEGEQLKCKFYE